LFSPSPYFFDNGIQMVLLMYSLWKNEMYYDPEHEQKKAARAEAFTAQDRNKNELVTS
jgi:transposase